MGTRGRIVAAAALAAVTALAPICAPGAQAVQRAPDQHRARALLPEPGGPYPIGTTSLRLADPGRPDPWVAGRSRELMISLWYPAARAPGPADRRAPYMAPAAGEHFGGPDGTALLNYGVTPGSTDWSGIRTHAVADAPALPGAPRPVLLYSAGLGDPRTWGTALVEDLASRGYVVVTVDHTYEASEVAFPDGRLATSVLPGMLGSPGLDIGAVLRTAMAARVADTRLVLDRLPGLGGLPGLPEHLGSVLDPTRIGMLGHSAGGFTALQAMHDDPRIAAAVDLDGQLHFPGPDGTGVHLSEVAEDGLDRPFLLLGTRSEDSGGHRVQPGWDALWQHSTGPRADFTLEASRHGSLTDAEPLLPALAHQGALPTDRLRADLGDLPPARAGTALHTYVAAFFDHWLRHRDTPLLDGPSPRFPEMTYHP